MEFLTGLQLSTSLSWDYANFSFCFAQLFSFYHELHPKRLRSVRFLRVFAPHYTFKLQRLLQGRPWGPEASRYIRIQIDSWRSWRMLNVSLAHASETLELWQSLNLWLWLSAVLWRHAVYSAVRMDEVLLPIQFWGFFESGKDDQLSWFSCRNLHERKLDQIQNIAELKVSPFLSLKSIWHTWPHLKSDSAGPRFYMGISCSTFNELAVVGVKDIRKQAARAKESSWVQRFAETRWCLY